MEGSLHLSVDDKAFVDLNIAQVGALKTDLMMMSSPIIDHFDHNTTNSTHCSGGCREDGCVQLLVWEGCEGNITILVVNNVVLF